MTEFPLHPPKAVMVHQEPGRMIGKKRPGLRSINDIKNFMLESIELHAAGLITAAEMRSRTAAAKDTAEVHAAVKLMELQGISFDMQAEATGLNYRPVVKRTKTSRSGLTLKGPIEEDTVQEVQEAAGDLSDSDPSPSLDDRRSFGNPVIAGPSEDDIIPW